MKDSFLILYLTFKRNGKTNLTVPFSKGFTDWERSNSSSASLCTVSLVSYFSYIRVFCFSLVTLQINRVWQKLNFHSLSAPLLFWNCQGSSAPEQPPERAGRVWRWRMLLLCDSRGLGWLSWGGCSAEQKSASQRGGEAGSCMRMTGTLSSEGSSHYSDYLIRQG